MSSAVERQEKQHSGSRYDEVQEVINHIYSASAQELADEVWTGKYGDDEVRRTVLGDRWQEVQDIVNDGGKKYHTIESGETLTKHCEGFRNNCRCSRFSERH